MEMSELFSYDKSTGVLRWKVSRSNRIKVGQVAGSVQTNHKGLPYERKYLHVRVGGKYYFVHRIIYEMVTGQAIPSGIQIDHRDGDGTNNKFDNLRLASRSQNMMNRNGCRNRINQLPKGVKWHAPSRLYVARLPGWSKYFKTPEAAKTAYDIEAERRYGEFARS